MKIAEILKEYDKRHEGILESKKSERTKKISGRWYIKKLSKHRKVAKK